MGRPPGWPAQDGYADFRLGHEEDVPDVRERRVGGPTVGFRHADSGYGDFASQRQCLQDARDGADVDGKGKASAFEVDAAFGASFRGHAPHNPAHRYAAAVILRLYHGLAVLVREKLLCRDAFRLLRRWFGGGGAFAPYCARKVDAEQVCGGQPRHIHAFAALRQRATLDVAAQYAALRWGQQQMVRAPDGEHVAMCASHPGRREFLGTHVPRRFDPWSIERIVGRRVQHLDAGRGWNFKNAPKHVPGTASPINALSYAYSRNGDAGTFHVRQVGSIRVQDVDRGGHASSSGTYHEKNPGWVDFIHEYIPHHTLNAHVGVVESSAVEIFVRYVGRFGRCAVRQDGDLLAIGRRDKGIGADLGKARRRDAVSGAYAVEAVVVEVGKGSYAGLVCDAKDGLL